MSKVLKPGKSGIHDLPPIKDLRRIFSAEPETGEVWKIDANGDRIQRVRSERQGKFDISLGCLGVPVYVARARVIWALVYNEWPLRVYHLNDDPRDDRLANLTLKSKKQRRVTNNDSA